MSINREVDGGVVVHTHNGMLFSHEKNKTVPSATARVALEIIMLSEVSQRMTNIIQRIIHISHSYMEPDF